jgi:uncharacterized protein
MPITVNLRHLEQHNVLLEGELPVEELDVDTRDEMIRAEHPLQYNLEVQKLEDSLLVEGSLNLVLSCHCVRCLKAFEHEVHFEEAALHVPLQGEDAAPVINDCVDLTPYIREDILLEFPQHPLCSPDCGGLPAAQARKQTSESGQDEPCSSAWAALNKLKFKN